VLLMLENPISKTRRFQILSLDGGGLKGLFQASFLAGWEEAKGCSVTNYFDLITGTSTGGIIALGLGMGFPAKELLNFYITEARSIFPPSVLSGLKHYFSVKYDANGLEMALKKYFRNRMLWESKVPLVIPAFYPKFNDVYLFKTPHHKRLQNDYREQVADVARATSAAPTYFSPYEGDNGVQLVDGGVWANNPVMIGIAEAMGYFAIPQSNVAALRIGTTTNAISLNKNPDSGGLISMAKAAMDFMMRGQELSASNMAIHLLGKDRYHEVNITVTPGDFALDRLTTELVGFGHTCWRTHSSELDDKGFFDHKPEPYKPFYKTESVTHNIQLK
jgi:patatin-like phospholipase/acyl hydrolase